MFLVQFYKYEAIHGLGIHVQYTNKEVDSVYIKDGYDRRVDIWKSYSDPENIYVFLNKHENEFKVDTAYNLDTVYKKFLKEHNKFVQTHGMESLLCVLDKATD